MADSKFFTSIKELPEVMLTEQSKSNMLMTDRVMISFIENPPGCVFPTHDHDAEQILVILEGEEDHICGEERFLMKAGDICIHPAGIPHGGETKTGFKGIDIFVPPRTAHKKLLEKVLAEKAEKEGK
jgi:quercetin dioxygenase-like cupin family protein